MIRHYRHVQLLAALVLLVVLGPFVDALIGTTVANLLLFVTMVSAIVACSTRTYAVVVGVALLVVLQSVAAYRAYHDLGGLSVAYSVVTIAFVTFVTLLVLIDVFRDSRHASADTICGALAVYVLVGVGFAFGHALLEQLVPGSITGLDPGSPDDYAEFLGYSFVTLTTVGYGNILPVSPMAESLAITEAMAGQIYLTVLVARLVALNLSTDRGTDAEQDPPQKQT